MFVFGEHFVFSALFIVIVANTAKAIGIKMNDDLTDDLSDDLSDDSAQEVEQDQYDKDPDVPKLVIPTYLKVKNRLVIKK